MRFILLVLGIALGVLGTVAYGVFMASPPVPASRPIIDNAPMTVALDQRFLTAVMQRAIADGAVAAPGVNVPRTQVKARLQRGLIVVDANVEVLGRATQGSLTLEPVLDAGRLRIRVVDTNLGAIQLPAIEQILETQINDRLGSLLDGIPVTVTSVGVDPARGLVVACHVDLDQLERAATTGTAAAL